MGRVNPGRYAALKALIATETGTHAEEALARLAPENGPDRGLAWHLCLGTLRLQGSIDYGLGPLLNKPIASLDAPVRCALRMGTFECARSRTPTRAAVHQTVEAVRAVGFGRACGFVNAVMRRAAMLEIDVDPKRNLPPWLWERWSEYGDWLLRIQEPARINLAGSKPVDTANLAAATIDGETVQDLWQLPTGSGQVNQVAGFDEGKFWVMDPAAARVADLLDEAMSSAAEVLDACAAPGGKSFRLAHHGHRVTAVDREEKRLDRMKENLDRLHLPIQLVQHDWLQGPNPAIGKFDGVLVDAPCTALGTVRRHPEILWRRQPGDCAAMSVQQRTILENASAHVKDGGCLVYAVCSTEPEEGRAVAESLQGWEIAGSWNSVPPRGDEDAFQAFVLRRGK